MYKVTAALVAAFACLSATGASAQADATGGSYLSLGYTRLGDSEDTDLGLNAATGRFGARKGHFGFEVEGSLGVRSESVSDDGITVDASLKHQVAAYLTGFVPVAANAEVFARLGYGVLELGAETSGLAEQTFQEGFLALGVGAQYFLGGGANGLRVDYTRLELDNGGDLDGGGVNAVGLSYVRRF